MTSGIADIRVERGRTEHLQGMVECHERSFPGEFMTIMGRPWLHELYRLHLMDPGGISVVAVRGNNEVVALAVGGKGALRDQFLRQAKTRFLPRILWKFLTHDLVRRRICQQLINLLLRRRAASTPPPTWASGKPHAALISICAVPECRGTGAADRVAAAFADACRLAGYQAAVLWVRSSNERATAFYAKHGWRKTYEVDADSIYWADLSRRAAVSAQPHDAHGSSTQ